MEIFSYLDAEDVLNCEMVSLQWNRVVRSVRYNWEEIYDRQVTKLPIECFIHFVHCFHSDAKMARNMEM